MKFTRRQRLLFRHVYNSKIRNLEKNPNRDFGRYDLEESDFRLLESVLAAKSWQNSRIFSSIALKKLMNIRFTI